jgi:hypothetical protein
MWPTIQLGPILGSSAPVIVLFSTGFKGFASGGLLTNIETNISGSGDVYDVGLDLSKAFTDYGVEIVWGRSVTWYWNAIGGPRRLVRQVLSGSGDAGVAIPTSADGETLFIKLEVVNGQASAWHTVWNGSDSDTFEVAAVQAYAQ